MNYKNYYRDPSGRVYGADYVPTLPGEKLTQKAGKAAYRAQACADLRKLLKPGQTVYCNLRRVSKSGMSRDISLFIVQGKELRDITYLAAVAMDDNLANGNRTAIKIGGCGMDMGFALVYNLGATLWPKGTRKPHGRRDGEPDSDGGYALKYSWS